MPETITIPGRAEFVALARAGIRVMLADAPPDAQDAAVLIASEYVTNAILWSRSGRGGEVRILVEPEGDGSARIEVTDDGELPPGERPVPEDPDQHGRGLEIAAGLAKDWGNRSERGRGVYWAVIAWD